MIWMPTTKDYAKLDEEFQRASTLHNGVISVDVNVSEWKDPKVDPNFYQFSLARAPLRNIELRPGYGSARVSVESEQIVLVRPGDLDYVYPEERKGETTRVNVAAILFREKLITDNFGSLQLQGLRDLQDPVSANLLKAMVNLDENSDPLLVDHVTMAILTRIRGLGQPESIRSKGRIERTIAYINERIDQKFTLDELAGAAAMSSFHFLRTFKEVTGMTPLAYVTSKRVERAKALLAKTDLPMYVISDMCGFSSQSHFSSAFKSSTGASPRAFRVSMGRKIIASLVAAVHWIYGLATEPISAPLMAMA